MENTVNAHELFLLCAIRKGKVVATNSSSYDWTFRHYSYWLSELSKHNARPEGMDLGMFVELKKPIIEEAKSKFPVQLKMERNFCLREGDTSVTLVDIDEDLTWYEPEQLGLKFAEGWVYKGLFILSVPLSESELYILKKYCDRKLRC